MSIRGIIREVFSWTAFLVEQEHQRRKYNRRYEENRKP